MPEGATLQTGIGSVPSRIVALLAEGDGGDYGVHSEMFTTGLMRLHEAGKVSNRKGQFDGVSVATFAAGSEDLYDWLRGNQDVAFLPVDLINSPELIARNRLMTTINGALAIDIHGQVVADTIAGSQFSGIGGHEDFISGPALSLEDRSLLCLPSTAVVGGETISRIVPWFEAGAVITTPRHQVDVVITEHGAAELQGLTVRQRGEALAAIAHPDFRDELMETAGQSLGRPGTSCMNANAAGSGAGMGSETRTVSPEQAREMLGSNEATAIDVRGDEEWRNGHIPGARHAGDDELEETLEKIDDEQTVIVACEDGKRSAEVAEQISGE